MQMQVAVVEVPNTGDGSLRVRLQARAQISMLPWLDGLTAFVNKLLQEMLILFQDPLGQDALACQDSQLVRFFAKDSVSRMCLFPALK